MTDLCRIVSPRRITFVAVLFLLIYPWKISCCLGLEQPTVWTNFPFFVKTKMYPSQDKEDKIAKEFAHLVYLLATLSLWKKESKVNSTVSGFLYKGRILVFALNSRTVQFRYFTSASKHFVRSIKSHHS